MIYLLTNITKTEGARFYIGSKSECNIINLNHVPTIISLNTNKPYYSSSANIEFKNDFLNRKYF